MEKELLKGSIGTVGNYDVEFKGGKLLASVNLAHDATEGVGASANLSVSIDAAKVIDAIERAVPGPIDDAVLEIMKKVLIG